jgi:large subunit ribosomal protein L9
VIEARRAELEKVAADKLAGAQAQAAKLEGLTIQITQKAGVDGRLFGSVTNVDIVESLKAQGFTVEKADIRMPAGPLKQVGEHPLVVALDTEAVANITVSVIGEQAGA